MKGMMLAGDIRVRQVGPGAGGQRIAFFICGRLRICHLNWLATILEV